LLIAETTSMDELKKFIQPKSIRKIIFFYDDKTRFMKKNPFIFLCEYALTTNRKNKILANSGTICVVTLIMKATLRGTNNGVKIHE